jgi:hypothetical protein
VSVRSACTGPAAVVPAGLRGYRMWCLNDDGIGLDATNLAFGTWPGPTLTAACKRIPCPHDAPMNGCGCGIYGWYRPDDTRMHNGSIFCVIEASGRVLLGDYGFRAQHARILALTSGDGRFAEHWQARGVDVFATREALIEAYPPDDVRELLGHDIPQGSPSLTGFGGLDFSAMTSAFRHLGVAMRANAEAQRRAFALVAEVYADAIRAQRSAAAPTGLRHSSSRDMTSVQRRALAQSKIDHRGPVRPRRGRARLDGIGW